MAMEHQNLALYTVHVEGSILALRDREFVDTVVAQSIEGENENALVLVTPEQVAKLPELLRVREIAPASDGIYVGRGGTWYAVKNGQVSQSGQWVVPHEILASFQNVSSSPAPEPITTPPTNAMPAESSAPAANPTPVASAPIVSVASQTGSDERDPVCGMRIKPGTEAANAMYQGKTYHFCSVECREIFLQNPARTIEQGAALR